MASNVFSEIIIFVSVLIIAAAVAGILATTTYKISIGINSKSDILSTELTQNFEIINDPGAVPRDPTLGITTFYIKNTGKAPIPFEKDTFTVIIDGIVQTINSTGIVGGSGNSLAPSQVGEINVSYNVSGYHRVKIVSEAGVSRTLKVYIE